MASPRILVVDDHAAIRESLAGYLGEKGFTVVTAPDGDGALAELAARPAELAMIDLVMDGMPGMELLSRIVAQYDIPVLVMTGFAEADSALEAIRRGAYEFLTKPIAPEMLPPLIGNALDHCRLARRERTEGRGKRLESYGSLIGRSRAMLEVFQAIEDVAATDSVVLLTGETGTGKNQVAREIHARSKRAQGPLVEVNCAAISPGLFESELFGHEKGAFTSAEARAIGRFERAAGGTLFLDEVSSLPLDLQGKLLRVLHDREFERVGGSVTLKSDVRVIAATNSDLETLVQEGRFRQDLYFRLCIFPIRLPPVRSRPEDIPLLLTRFATEVASRLGRDVPGISPEAVAEASAHGWPGNVREVWNAVERSAIRCRDERIDSFLRPPTSASLPPDRPAGGEPLGSLRHEHDRFLHGYLVRLLRSTGGSLEAAGRVSGVDPRTLQRYLKRLKLSLKELRALGAAPARTAGA